jgi:hypothetical protein
MEEYFLKEIQDNYHVTLEEFYKIGSVMQTNPKT